MKEEKEKIERVVLKLPKSVADYFRSEFAHGKRSKFVIKCLHEHKHQQDIKRIESKLKKARKRLN